MCCNMKETRTIVSTDVDSRDSIPFDEGDEVTLTDKPACGAWIRANGESLVGKLHSDDKTFVFQQGIRTNELTLE